MALLTIMEEKQSMPKLTSRTPASFKEEVEDLRTRLQRQKRWLYRGEKVSLEAIINVAVLEFLRMDLPHQAKILAARIPELEAMFEAEKGREPTPPDVFPGESVEKAAKLKKGRAG